MAVITVVSFNYADGTNPYGSLIADVNGNLFGTTNCGGNGYGTVFEIAKTASGYASTPTTLVSFNVTEGFSPYGGLIADASGDLFGTTGGGGTDVGTVFEIAKTASGYASTPTTLVNFTGSNGHFPGGSLIADARGDLFGTTEQGGANGFGTVFEIAKTASGYASTPTTLVSFNGTDGIGPYGSLIADANGDLFGTTGYGGANGGTVFEIVKTASGYASAPTTLVSFTGSNGAEPLGSLIADANGDLFGTTASGGAYGYGTVFEIAKTASGYASTPTTLVSFNITDGARPHGSLIVDASGDLFGTTGYGAYGDYGTVFEIVKTASGYASTPTILLSFNGSNGAYPLGSLIADANGDLFGTTANGGANNNGTVFEITGSGFVPLAILGTVANQQASPFKLMHPFANVVINDVTSSQTETVTIKSSAIGLNGLLFDPHARTDGSHSAHGVYTVTGSAAAVTADLQGLLFIASRGTTHFEIDVTDSAGATATDQTTSIVGIHFGPFV